MDTLYDTYNYPQYWQGREYEDSAEKMALRKFLKIMPRKGTLVDIGAGHGRLTKVYAPFFKKSFLIEPSDRLLKTAQNRLKNRRNLTFKKGRTQKLPLPDKRFDAALMVRLSHHLPQLEKPFKEVHRVLKPKGFFVFEFANKIHFKASFKAFFKGRFRYFLFHTPKDISRQKAVKFFNYHPSHIKSLLQTNGFKIVKVLSVSNFRQTAIKKLIPLKILLALESVSQGLLAPHFFGPSIFILAQKE